MQGSWSEVDVCGRRLAAVVARCKPWPRGLQVGPFPLSGSKSAGSKPLLNYRNTQGRSLPVAIGVWDWNRSPRCCSYRRTLVSSKPVRCRRWMTCSVNTSYFRAMYEGSYWYTMAPFSSSVYLGSCSASASAQHQSIRGRLVKHNAFGRNVNLRTASATGQSPAAAPPFPQVTCTLHFAQRVCCILCPLNPITSYPALSPVLRRPPTFFVVCRAFQVLSHPLLLALHPVYWLRLDIWPAQGRRVRVILPFVHQTLLPLRSWPARYASHRLTCCPLLCLLQPLPRRAFKLLLHAYPMCIELDLT